MPRPASHCALGLLLQAKDCADSQQRSLWDFAVEMPVLLAQGLTATDLRYLVCQGIVEHRVEETRPKNRHRLFRRVLSLSFHRRSCFTLTETGCLLARQVLGSYPAAVPPSAFPLTFPRHESTLAKPYWDRKGHTLYLGNHIIKHFKSDAPNQEAVLNAFQKRGWPRSCIVCVPRECGTNPKKCLRDTIKNLNRSIKQDLHFEQEGNGSRVTWQLTGASALHANPTQTLPNRDRCN